MLRRTLLTAFIAVAVIAAVTPATSATTSQRTASYIVMLQNTADANSVAAEHSRSQSAVVDHVYQYAIHGYSARMTATAAARIGRDPRVLLVQPDAAVTVAAQTLPTGINRVDAELSPTARIDGIDERVDVDVAVLDTGIDLTHPDLNVYTTGAKNCSTGTSANDRNGHGTHVSGTIGALDNGLGVVGVAPGARLWPVRVLNNAGSGSFDESSDAKNRVPAAYDEVITVSALADFNGLPGGGAPATCRSDVDDTFADFSNFGADVDLIAPGVCILSTWKAGGYNTISGTSMATPHVSGGVALYKATHPSASPATVKSALQAAGTLDWNTATDPDGNPDTLLNVRTF